MKPMYRVIALLFFLSILSIGHVYGQDSIKHDPFSWREQLVHSIADNATENYAIFHQLYDTLLNMRFEAVWVHGDFGRFFDMWNALNYIDSLEHLRTFHYPSTQDSLHYLYSKAALTASALLGIPGGYSPEVDSALQLASYHANQSNNHIDQCNAYIRLIWYYGDCIRDISSAAFICEEFVDTLRSWNDTLYCPLLYAYTANLASLLYTSGRMNEALYTIDTAAQQIKNRYGYISQPYYTLIGTLCQHYIQVGDINKAFELLDSLQDIGQKSVGDTIFYDINLEKQRASIYSQQGRYHDAIIIANGTLDIQKKYNRHERISTLFNLMNLGVLANDTATFLNAEHECEQFFQALDMYTTDHYYFCILANKLRHILRLPELEVYRTEAAVLCKKEGFDQDLIEDLNFTYGTASVATCRQKTSASINYHLTNWAYLTRAERERMLYNELASYTKFKNHLFSNRQNDSIDDLLYNYVLFTKGLQQGIESELKTAIRSSKNNKLQSIYDTLQTLHIALENSHYSFDKNAIRQLEKENARVEREMMHILKKDTALLDKLRPDYRCIANTLGKNEVAIEYVRYDDWEYYADGLNTLSRYAALVLRSGWEKPRFIPLGNARPIDRLLSQRQNGMPTQYGFDETSAILYLSLWQPITPYVQPGETVYFSPDGALHGFALENLAIIGKDTRLYELYHMRRCHSTKVILENRQPIHYSRAALFGDIDYSADNTLLLAHATQIGYSQTLHRNIQWSPDTNEFFCTPLDSTAIEIEAIARMMKRRGFEPQLYTGLMANEEAFKALSGKDIDIIHVASHGFYMPMSNSGNRSTSVNNAMHSAGICFAGANNRFANNYQPDGMEDGILTPAEVELMQFDKVKLAVLSACQTGVGAVKSDGVYGFQRAFKYAGVQTLIMSLWNVGDASTSFLMQAFYRRMLAGQEIHYAFDKAKDETRRRWPNPQSWAAFILLD